MNVFIWKPCIALHWLLHRLRPWVGLSDIIIQNLSQNSCCSASGHQTSTSAAKLAGMLACKIFSWKMLILNLMHWLAHYIQRRDFFLIGNLEEELWKWSFVKKTHSAVPCKGGWLCRTKYARFLLIFNSSVESRVFVSGLPNEVHAAIRR